MIAPAPYTVELLIEPAERAHPARMDVTLIDFERQGQAEAGTCDFSLAARSAELSNGRPLPMADFIERLKRGEPLPEEHGMAFGRALLGYLLAETSLSRAWEEISEKRLSAGRAMRLLLSIGSKQRRGARIHDETHHANELMRMRSLPFELLADSFGFLFRSRGHVLVRVDEISAPTSSQDDKSPETQRVGSDPEPLGAALRAHQSGLSRAFPWTSQVRTMQRAQREFLPLEEAIRLWTEQVSSVPAGPDAAPIPLRTPYFTGRNDDIHRCLDSLSSSRLVTITGAYGIGKTELCANLAHHLFHTKEHRLAYPALAFESVLWFSLEGIGAVDALRARMALALGLDPLRCRKDEDLAQVIGSLPTLIVLDGADAFVSNPLSLTRFQWLMNTLLAHCDELRFLITSVQPIGDVSVPGGDIPLALEMPLELGPLAAPSDLELFTRALGSRLRENEIYDSASDIAQLVAFYGGHPRALLTAASLIDTPSDLQALLLHLQSEENTHPFPSTFYLPTPQSGQTHPHETIARRYFHTLRLSSLDLLDEEPQAAQMLAWLSLLPAGLPEVLFPFIFGPESPPTLAVLIRRRLVDRHENDRHQRLCVPLSALPPLADHLSTLLPPERRATLLLATFSALAAWFLAPFEHPGTWRDRDRAVQQASNIAALILDIPEPQSPGEPESPLAHAIAAAVVPFAQLMMRAGGTRSASEIVRETVRKVSILGGGTSLAALLTALGDLLVRIERLEDAEAAYRQALPMYSALEDHYSLAGTLLALGDIGSRMGKREQAHQYLQQALAFYQALHERQGEANVMRALGDLYVKTDRLKEAEDAYRQALPIYEAMGERWGEASVRQAYGDLLLRNDRLREAELELSKALPLYRTMDEALGEANTLQALGDLYTRTRRFKEAEDAYQRALPIYKNHESPLGEASCLRALGELFILSEQWTEAETTLRQALGIYRFLHDKLGRANTLQSLGKLALIQQDGERAYTWFLAAHTLHSEAGDRLGIGGDRGYLARAARISGQHLRAVVLGKAALAALDKQSEPYGLFVAARDLARALAALGDREGATSAWFLAWSLAYRVGDPGAASIAVMLSAVIPDFETGPKARGPSEEEIAMHEGILGATLAAHEARLKDAGEDVFGPLYPEGERK